MREIHAHIRLIIGVVEVVDPRGGVGINIHDISIHKIVWSCESPGDSLTHYLSVVIDESCVLGYHRQFHRYRLIGVVLPPLRVETVATPGSLGVIVSLVTIVELLGVKLFHSGYRIGAVKALYGSLFILICITPGNSLSPVEMRCHRVPLPVLLYPVLLIASVGRIGKTLADYGITHPEHKLLVLGISDFGFVHPERVDRHPARISLDVP